MRIFLFALLVLICTAVGVVVPLPSFNAREASAPAPEMCMPLADIGPLLDGSLELNDEE